MYRRDELSEQALEGRGTRVAGRPVWGGGVDALSYWLGARLTAASSLEKDQLKAWLSLRREDALEEEKRTPSRAHNHVEKPSPCIPLITEVKKRTRR